MAGPMVGPILKKLGHGPGRALLRAGRRVPRPRTEPAAGREPAADHRHREEREVPTSASPGTVTRTAASSSTATGGSATATSSAPCSPEPRLQTEPGGTILYDPRSSRAVPDVVAAAGGRTDLSRVGHAFFKTTHARGEAPSSAARSRATTTSVTSTAPTPARSRPCDCSQLLSVEGRASPRLMEEFHSKYFISGEINSEVADPQAKMDEIEAMHPDAEITHLDGVSIDYEDWHFNVRPSNTEPLLRLNLESLVSREDMEQKRDEILAVIRWLKPDPTPESEAALAQARDWGIHTIPVPTPFAVGRINCYLIEGDPLTLIDAGPRSEKSWQGLEAGIERSRPRSRGHRADGRDSSAHRSHRPDQHRRRTVRSRSRGDRPRRPASRRVQLGLRAGRPAGGQPDGPIRRARRHRERAQGSDRQLPRTRCTRSRSPSLSRPVRA